MKEKLREIAMISAVISDHYMKLIYEQSGIGYIACLDLIADCSLAFFEKYGKLKGEDWEAIYHEIGGAKKHGFKGNPSCWEECIFSFSVKWFKDKHGYNLPKNFIAE